MRREMLLGVISLLMLAVVLAAEPQAPAAAAAGNPGTRVAVVDFQKAVTENSEGKKAQEKFLGELNKREKEFQDKQKALTETQTKLQNGEKTLSDSAKGDLAKQIDRLNVDLQRMNDDAQKELGELQQTLFRPIADRTQKVLQSYSAESGFAVVFDVSSQASSIIHWEPVADITTEIIRRVDADAAKAPPAAKPAEPAKK
jgi:Skp family chaperone for outer membrane proteins